MLREGPPYAPQADWYNHWCLLTAMFPDEVPGGFARRIRALLFDTNLSPGFYFVQDPQTPERKKG